MKTFFIVIVFSIFLPLEICSQNEGAIIDTALYEVEYKYTHKKDLLKPNEKYSIQYSLLIGKKWSLYYNKHNDFTRAYLDKLSFQERFTQSYDSNGVLTITANPSLPQKNGETEYLYINSSNNDLIYSIDITSSGFLYYEESYTMPEWELSPDSKEVNGVMCQKAVANFKGREWIAWFAPSIPLNYGPWQLRGLPGLILEAYDSEDQIHYVVAFIQDITGDLPIYLKGVDNGLKKSKSALRRNFENDYNRTGGMAEVIARSVSMPERRYNHIERE